MASECVTKNTLLTLWKHLQKPVTFSCIQSKTLGSFNKYSLVFSLMDLLFPEGKESDPWSHNNVSQKLCQTSQQSNTKVKLMELKPDSWPQTVAMQKVLKIDPSTKSRYPFWPDSLIRVQKFKLLSPSFNPNLLSSVSSHGWPQAENLLINILLAKQHHSFMMPSCLIFKKRTQWGIALVIIWEARNGYSVISECL